MAGLLAVSWREGDEARAHKQFDEACAAFARLKGLARTGDAAWRNARVARFASPFSPYPDVFRRAQVATAAAGWLFLPQRSLPTTRVLEEFADAVLSDADRAFDALQGQYLAVAVRGDDGAVLGAGDKLGLFPAYIAETDTAAWVSTSSVVLAATLRPRLDVEALRGLFMGGQIRAPRSAFQGIRRLCLGERVSLRRGQATVSKAWCPFPPSASYTGIEEAAEEGSRILRDTCRRVADAWPSWLCDLTAGLDSRLVLAHLAEFAHPAHVTVSGTDGHIDVEVARRISSRFGCELHQVRPPTSGAGRWPLFERAVVLADGELPGHALDRTLRLKIDFARGYQATVGGGLGELCRDFFWQQEFWRIGRTPGLDIPRLLRYRFFFGPPPDMSLFQRDWRHEYFADQVRTIEQLVSRAPGALNTAKLDVIYAWKQSGHVGRYLGAIFPVIAAVHPLGTSQIYEFMTSVPWRYRLCGQLVRHMIARSFPGLAAMPTWYGGSAEPFSVLRPGVYMPFLAGSAQKLIRKLGQITTGHAIFKDPTVRETDSRWDAEFVQSLASQRLLEGDNFRSAGLYRREGLRRLLEDLESGRSQAYGELFTVMSIEALCRQCDLDPGGESL